MRFVTPSARPPWRVHFPEPRPESARAAWHRARSTCRPRATPRRPDGSGGSVRHPLPDDRRIGCRDGRRSGPGTPVRRGTAGVRWSRSGPRRVPRRAEARCDRRRRPGNRARPCSEEQLGLHVPMDHGSSSRVSRLASFRLRRFSRPWRVTPLRGRPACFIRSRSWGLGPVGITHRRVHDRAARGPFQSR
jgi:hypothetical protein